MPYGQVRRVLDVSGGARPAQSPGPGCRRCNRRAVAICRRNAAPPRGGTGWRAVTRGGVCNWVDAVPSRGLDGRGVRGTRRFEGAGPGVGGRRCRRHAVGVRGPSRVRIPNVGNVSVGLILAAPQPLGWAVRGAVTELDGRADRRADCRANPRASCCADACADPPAHACGATPHRDQAIPRGGRRHALYDRAAIRHHGVDPRGTQRDHRSVGHQDRPDPACTGLRPGVSAGSRGSSRSGIRPRRPGSPSCRTGDTPHPFGCGRQGDHGPASRRSGERAGGAEARTR